MNFSDSLKAAGGALYGAMQQQAEEMKRLRERYERCGDEDLLREVKTASGNRRLAIAGILKDRGYSVDEILGRG